MSSCMRSRLWLCSLICPAFVKQCLIEETCAKPFFFLSRFGNVFQFNES